MNKRRAIWAGISILLFIGIVIPVSLYTGYIQFNYPSRTEFPIQGIDVSHHQGNIKWGEINKEEVNFVYIKATEGGDFKDEQFVYNWQEAQKHQIPVGAYHFFTFCRSGEDQALNFIQVVPKGQGILPPVIDLEYGGNCKLTRSKEEVLKEIEILENQLFIYYNKKPVLYVTQEFYKDFLIGRFKDNPIWIRDIYNKPELEDGRDWLFWQYGNREHRKGIDIYVDLNVFKGTREQWQEIIK